MSCYLSFPFLADRKHTQYSLNAVVAHLFQDLVCGISAMVYQQAALGTNNFCPHNYHSLNILSTLGRSLLTQEMIVSALAQV